MYNYAAYGEPYPFSYQNHAPAMGVGQMRLNMGLSTPGAPSPSTTPSAPSEYNPLSEMPFYHDDLPEPSRVSSPNNALSELPFYGHEFARGGQISFKKTGKTLTKKGRHGDNILAHIQPHHAHMLKSMGGSGTINPATGLPEYFLPIPILGALVGAGIGAMTSKNKLKGALTGAGLGGLGGLGLGAFGINSMSSLLGKEGLGSIFGAAGKDGKGGLSPLQGLLLATALGGSAMAKPKPTNHSEFHNLMNAIPKRPELPLINFHQAPADRKARKEPIPLWQDPPEGEGRFYEQPHAYARGGASHIDPHRAAEMLQSKGRGGDTILAHINPFEAHMLKSMGGSGTINPATGLPEFGFFDDIWGGIKNVASDIWGGVKNVASDGYNEIKHVAPKIIESVAPIAGAAAGTLLGKNPIAGMMGAQLGQAVGNAFADEPAPTPHQEVYAPYQVAPYQMPDYQMPFQSYYPMQEMPGYARGGLTSMAQNLQMRGRGGDTILAHIQPHHAYMLKSMGGSGTINPATGLPEFGNLFEDFLGGVGDMFGGIAEGIGNLFRGGGGIANKVLGAIGGNMLLGPLGGLAGFMGGVPGVLGTGLGAAYGGPMGALAGLALGSGLGGGLGGQKQQQLHHPDDHLWQQFVEKQQPKRPELPLIDFRARAKDRKARKEAIPLWQDPPEGEGRFYEDPFSYAEGGNVGHDVDMTPGGFLNGTTQGQADKIPAYLSDGEFVMPADIVSALGDGNSAAGSKKLYNLIDNVRKQKATKGFPPKAKPILSYMKG